MLSDCAWWKRENLNTNPSQTTGLNEKLATKELNRDGHTQIEVPRVCVLL